MRAVDRIILAMNFILSAVFAGSVLLFVEQLTAGRAWFGHVVLAAPVLGHAFPLFHRFRGGKGIAVSFGCLLGLMPFWRPFAILAGFFLLFSLIVVITPNFQRTLVTFLCSAFTMFLRFGVCGISLGFLFMTCIVCLRLHMSRELRMKMKIALGHSR